MPDESIRCAFCDRLLAAATIEAGECGCQHKHNDVRMAPSGALWLTRYDPVTKRYNFTELLPVGYREDELPDSRAVLVRRTVDGRALPVTEMFDGSLVAVDVLRDAS